MTVLWWSWLLEQREVTYTQLIYNTFKQSGKFLIRICQHLADKDDNWWKTRVEIIFKSRWKVVNMLFSNPSLIAWELQTFLKCHWEAWISFLVESWSAINNTSHECFWLLRALSIYFQQITGHQCIIWTGIFISYKFRILTWKTKILEVSGQGVRYFWTPFLTNNSIK